MRRGILNCNWTVFRARRASTIKNTVPLGNKQKPTLLKDNNKVQSLALWSEWEMPLPHMLFVGTIAS